jgi:hypothetical protein
MFGGSLTQDGRDCAYVTQQLQVKKLKYTTSDHGRVLPQRIEHDPLLASEDV